MMKNYILTRRRGMKNLRLRVDDNGIAHVSAPYDISQERIDEFVRSRAAWINARRAELSERKTELSNGSTITIFDKTYTVEIQQGNDDCRAREDTLIVTLSDPDNTARVEQLVLAFMAKLCRKMLEAEFVFYLALSDYCGEPPTLRFALLKSRWGSYNRRTNVITFNLYLCKLPRRFAGYVAAHEVVHLLVPNHSELFYALGERLYSGFRKTDRELNKQRIRDIFS